MYKRLSNEELNDFTSRVVVQLEPALTQQVMSLILELNEYRTKIENKTLIDLPCKVGDTVYFISGKIIREEIVKKVEYIVTNGKINVYNSYICTYDFNDKDDNFYRLSKLGKSLFPTKTEAEATIKRGTK